MTLDGVSYEFISGVCDPSTPLLGGIINSAAGDAIEGSISDGFTSQLADPDGAGPEDSPVADAIETALADISIAGPVGEAVRATLDAPFTSITESPTGIDFRADADFQTSVGDGPGQCQPPAGAPDLTSSYHVDGGFPSLGGTTPRGQDYGLGLTISASAFTGGSEKTWLTLSVDAPLGFDMAFDAAAGQLAPTITPPSGDQVTSRVHGNDIGTDEAALEAVFSQLFPNFVESLSAGFGAFPLPGFLGLDLDVVETARHGDHYTLYAMLTPQRQTRLENVTVTDLSTADHATDSVLFDSWEWRHRLRKRISSDRVSVNLDGMLGADACCTTGDKTDDAHAGYRIALDVVPENGDTWQLDLAHLIKGAHTANNEGYAARSSISAITGRYQVDGGAWQTFSVDVAADGAGDGHPGRAAGARTPSTRRSPAAPAPACRGPPRARSWSSSPSTCTSSRTPTCCSRPRAATRWRSDWAPTTR